MGNHGNSEDTPSHPKSSWRLNELMIGGKQLLLKRTTFCEGASYDFERMTSQAWPLWRNKKEAGVQKTYCMRL